MTAIELYEQGRIAAAVEAQRAALAVAADPQGSLFLTLLLLFQGDLDGAALALASVPDEPHLLARRNTYADLIAAERQRWNAFEEGEFPAHPDGVPEHLRFRWRAMECLFDRSPEEVIDCVDQADAFTPNLCGHIDGREFTGIRDTDDLFATVVEFLSGGRYYWLGFEQLRRIRFIGEDEPREDLYREVILVHTDGRESHGFLPVLYFGTHLSEEEAIRAGLETDFFAIADGPLRGIGRRIWLIGDEEITLPDCRQLDISGVAM